MSDRQLLKRVYSRQTRYFNGVFLHGKCCSLVIVTDCALGSSVRSHLLCHVIAMCHMSPARAFIIALCRAEHKPCSGFEAGDITVKWWGWGGWTLVYRILGSSVFLIIISSFGKCI